jgi:hypothetical protein
MYIIQTEGRELKEVLKVGNTVRIDHMGLSVSNVTELNDFNYEVKKGHENGEYTVFYVTIIGKKQLNKYTGKRYVTKNSYNLGIDSEIWDDEKEKYIPFWYIYDKATNTTIEGYEDAGEGARGRLKRQCNKLNNKYEEVSSCL